MGDGQRSARGNGGLCIGLDVGRSGVGTALLAAVGAGIHDDVDAAGASAVRPKGPIERPDLELAAIYQGVHQKFKRLYPALKTSQVWQGEVG